MEYLWPPPGWGPSLLRGLTEPCGQVHTQPSLWLSPQSLHTDGRDATTTASLMAVAFPQAGALQIQTHWRIHVEGLTFPLPKIR